MFLLRKPSAEAIREFLAAQQDQPFSYGAVGASRKSAPLGYTVDHNRVRLGEGRELFGRAVKAVQNWRMFKLGWVQLCYPDALIAPGTTVGVLIRHYGFWSLNACRIVYLIEESGLVQKYGFAYGTLPEHGERGEERFTVEWHRDDNSVWYDLLAFSQPNNFLAKAGYPLTRRLQKRFASESKRAMLRASQEIGF